MGRSKLTSVQVNLPFISGTWAADDEQRRAAWEMYVELVTRISIQPLGPDEGLLREAVSSLYVLFGETRRILREHGPGVARPERKQLLAFGQIAIDVLNHGLRPFLARWHPLLTEHEASRGAASATAHERAWPLAAPMRADLTVLQTMLTAYADLLAEACNIPPLHRASDGPTSPA